MSHPDQIQPALSWLERPRVYDFELVKRELVPIDRTPLPYKMEDTLTVECPECDRVAFSVHPWRLVDYLERWTPCECGFDGDLDVR